MNMNDNEFHVWWHKKHSIEALEWPSYLFNNFYFNKFGNYSYRLDDLFFTKYARAHEEKRTKPNSKSQLNIIY